MEKYTWKKKPLPFSNFLKMEEYYFKDFSGPLTISKNYKIKDLDKAKEIIELFLNQPIRIVGDYDVDGDMGTSEGVLLLNAMGAKDVKYYIPKRISDGYGISKKIIDNFLGETTPGLLITIDNGISAIEAIQYAKSLGWQVLIIDHHLAAIDNNGNTILPDADVIIDPNAIPGSASFTDYCAAGLIYKLAQYIEIDSDILSKINTMAAIATIADCVNLMTEVNGSIRYDNYIIVKEGLHTAMQNEGRTTGLYCLLRALNKDIKLEASDISFTIGPVINALSRLNDDGASHVVKLLLTDGAKFNECDAMAQEMITANDTRKELTRLAIPLLKEKIEIGNMQDDYPIVVSGQMHPGLAGLIAGKLEEEYNTAVVVLVENEDNEILHGSARAPVGTNIKEILDNCAEYLESYGGHAQAAGLAVRLDKLDEFRKAAQKAAGKKPDNLLDRYYDFEISTKDIKDNLSILSKYQPFGIGHKAPIFKIKNFISKKKFGEFYKVMGAEKNTIKIYGLYADAMNFSGQGVEKYQELGNPLRFNLYGKLTVNSWNGKDENQIHFQDMDV